MAATDAITLDYIVRYTAEPNDVVIYKTTHRLNPDEMDRIRTIHRDTFGPDIKALILDGTIEMHVIENLAIDDQPEYR